MWIGWAPKILNKINKEFKSWLKTDLMKLDIDTLSMINSNIYEMKKVIHQANELFQRSKKFPQNKVSILNNIWFETEAQKNAEEVLKLTPFETKNIIMTFVWSWVISAWLVYSPTTVLTFWAWYFWTALAAKAVHKYRKSRLADKIVDKIDLNFIKN